MAKVVITVQDDGDEIDVKTEFDPPVKGDEPGTQAQRLGLVMIQAAFDVCGRGDPDE